MDFELKNFEDKINDITNQFMSLLDSNEIIENTVGSKFESTSKSYGLNMDGIVFDTVKGVDTGYTYNPENNDEQADLNKRLEELYQTRKFDSGVKIDAESAQYLGQNVGVFNNVAANSRVSYTNDKTSSYEDKEGYTMANYGFNAEDENSLFSFATIPEERALVAKRGFSDVLFMDIPWDTKIDIWGGIKSFLNTDVRFTF